MKNDTQSEAELERIAKRWAFSLAAATNCAAKANAKADDETFYQAVLQIQKETLAARTQAPPAMGNGCTSCGHVFDGHHKGCKWYIPPASTVMGDVNGLVEGPKIKGWGDPEKVMEVLRKHHAWHQNIGEVYFPADSGTPQDVAVDLSDGYADSALCEETVAALSPPTAKPSLVGVETESSLRTERDMYRAWIVEMAAMSPQHIYRSKAIALLEEGDRMAYPTLTKPSPCGTAGEGAGDAELLEEYGRAKAEAAETCDGAHNSYGCGYDSGYREGIRWAIHRGEANGR